MDSETSNTEKERVVEKLSSIPYKLCNEDDCKGPLVLCIGISLLIIAYLIEKRTRPAPAPVHDLNPPEYAKLFPNKP